MHECVDPACDRYAFVFRARQERKLVCASVKIAWRRHTIWVQANRAFIRIVGHPDANVRRSGSRLNAMWALRGSPNALLAPEVLPGRLY